jgi:pyruvate,water dikinase
MKEYIKFFEEISKNDTALVGGKNASLGEMFNQLSSKGVRVPYGFALTINAYWDFLKFNNIDKKLEKIFSGFNPKSVSSLQKVSRLAQKTILGADFSQDLKNEIINAYKKLSSKYNLDSADVAVRSSGVAEDSPKDSFAGQFETLLNIRGEKMLLQAIKKCFASAFGERVIAYREEKKVSHLKFALSVGVQKMVRSDLASSGVIFTLDTESGFENVVLVTGLFGVGEMIVQGRVTPDEFYVFKPTLKDGFKPIIVKNLGRKDRKYIYSKKGGLKEVFVPKEKQRTFCLEDDEILSLAKWAILIQDHYGRHQDIEWAKDGITGELFIVQARPETVHSSKKVDSYNEYILKTEKTPVLKGIAVGNKIGQGKVRVIYNVSEISKFKKGEVLVTKMTDPDWVSIFPLASAIITDEGGKTSHAAIVSRELGLPCIVGTKIGTKVLKTGDEVTVDCTRGEVGMVFKGIIPYTVKSYNLSQLPKLNVKIMVNIGAPEIAFKNSFLPQDGVGLARQEFIIAEKIKVHPLALCYYEEIKKEAKGSSKISKKFNVPRSKLKKLVDTIDELTIEHRDKKEYFVKELAEGIGQITAAFWPKSVILRLSDLKSNEYSALIGGELFEPKEENPMLGWRGASRYYDEKFEPAFKLECEAIKRVRDLFGLKNLKIMIPFCRTPQEGEKVLGLMEKFGLKRGEDGLEVYVMCEIPSNVILLDKFLDIFDGVSIGSNDLSQLVLGIDRDSSYLSKIGDERNEAVKYMISQVIKKCNERNKYCGICGQAPSDFPEFAEFLLKEGIHSISLNPDTVIKTILKLQGQKDL